MNPMVSIVVSYHVIQMAVNAVNSILWDSIKFQIKGVRGRGDAQTLPLKTR